MTEKKQLASNNESETEINPEHSKDSLDHKDNENDNPLARIEQGDCEKLSDNIEEFDDLLEHIGVPDETRPKVEAMIKAYTYRGPLPHPKILHGYEEVLPGSADRIIKMAENQQNHRIKSTEKLIKAETEQSKIGLVFAFTLSMVMLLGGIILIGIGNDLSGYILIIPTIAGLIALFIKENFKINEKK